MRQLLFLLLGVASLSAAADELSGEDMRALARANVVPAVDQFRRFLALPNDANHRDDLEQLITWMETEFAAHGFETWRLATQSLPVLIAERAVAGADGTVLIYLQADGQPVDAQAWNQPDPYEAVLKRLDGKDGWELLDWESL
jgi:acetylornithine deacetylase/succinyl-diaminopimelate desuccinylase-like protein